MQVVYSGPIDAVEIAELGLEAKRGEPVEVPDEVGERLLRQDCWQPAKADRKAAVSEEHN